MAFPSRGFGHHNFPRFYPAAVEDEIGPFLVFPAFQHIEEHRDLFIHGTEKQDHAYPAYFPVTSFTLSTNQFMLLMKDPSAFTPAGSRTLPF